ncbi:hypothetical protein [Xanthovirga aplysinae]|uniref:hypothetical protein n=1 Tax=Xanthovirga aplysinae TaxID=2529853 RepID=UPI0012BB7481|nr:hypothetical protein [Xanthovirga aplysinae]MTI31874.1 hypothetical protein [Xanthovirga aplysinae]
MKNVISWYNDKVIDLQVNRLGVLAFMFLFHANLTAPLTLWSIHSAGNNPLQFFICVLGAFAIIIPNIAVAPVKVTIPIFLITSLSHWMIILVNFV